MSHDIPQPGAIPPTADDGEPAFAALIARDLPARGYLIRLCTFVWTRAGHTGGQVRQIYDSVLNGRIARIIKPEAKYLWDQRGQPSWTTVSDLTQAALAILISHDAPQFVLSVPLSPDAAEFQRKEAHYLRLIVGMAFDRERTAATAYLRVEEPNEEDPAGHPVRRRVRVAKYRSLPAEYAQAPAAGRISREQTGVDDADELVALFGSANLNDLEKAIVRGFYYEDRPLREVAQRVGVTAGAVYQAHHRLLNKLKDAWAG